MQLLDEIVIIADDSLVDYSSYAIKWSIHGINMNN